ncbi:Ras-related protein [Takifugu flavidus]|uniref:Ras-related protein n=1 Tax=Takifugu flavidus TaxID=433684 RepID=A0A5C6MLB0_9TELE|nr:Ras-related protein [Takifugu flavidus]
MTNEFPDGKRWKRAEHDVTILAPGDVHKVARSRSNSGGGGGGGSNARASQELSIQTRIFKIIVIGDSNVGKTCLTFRFTGGGFPDRTEATIGVDFREKAVEIEGETIKPQGWMSLVVKPNPCSKAQLQTNPVWRIPPVQKVQVWDTAGQERFRKSMVKHYYHNVHAVVFVYDVTNMTSFCNLQTWIEPHLYSPSLSRTSLTTPVTHVLFQYQPTVVVGPVQRRDLPSPIVEPPQDPERDEAVKKTRQSDPREPLMHGTSSAPECNSHRVSASVPRVLVGNKCDLVDRIQVPSSVALRFADTHNMLLFETSAKDPKESQNVDCIFMALACRLKTQKFLIYRDVDSEDARVHLTQNCGAKSNCPC